MADKLTKYNPDSPRVAFFCPGCESSHEIPVEGPHKWEWNGSMERPTFAPSILLYAHKSSPPFKDQPQCHSFVRDGMIQFLGDCTHGLVGQTVEIPDWED